MKKKRKTAARPYKIVITIQPSEGCATIRSRGKTVTLRYPEHGWEFGQPRRHDSSQLRQPTYTDPVPWMRFYIQGGNASPRKHGGKLTRTD